MACMRGYESEIVQQVEDHVMGSNQFSASLCATAKIVLTTAIRICLVSFRNTVQKERFSIKHVKLIASALVLHCFDLWLVCKTRANFSTNEKQKQNQLHLARARFPAFCAYHMSCHCFEF